jgi:putative oxygen-independent coproporphyrinogen III oxidase
MTLAAPRTALPRPRDVIGEFGLYVHVPFCSSRCWYCDFNAYSGLDHTIDRYMQALVRDAELALSAPTEADLDPRPAVSSIFIGGGTPSLVPPSAIGSVLRAIRTSWDVVSGAEITIECNPDSVDAAKLDAYLEAGINRVSIGVQTLDARLLASLGRQHSPQAAVDALRLARDRGFQDVSADLIFGIPGEDDDTFRASLDGVLDAGVSHVSAYALIYEDGTPLGSWRKLGKIVPVPDDDVAARWELTDRVLCAAGLARYEISNWARPARASRHNSLYWACGEYLGIGVGAHSHLAGGDHAVRSWTIKAPQRYVEAIARGERPVAGRERIDRSTRASEVMMLGLRRSEGVSFARFEALVGRVPQEVFGPELDLGVRRGLLRIEDASIRTARPLLGNEASLLFVDAAS